MKINKFNQSEMIENEPYIIICFNVNLKQNDNNPEGVLKGVPVRELKI